MVLRKCATYPAEIGEACKNSGDYTVSRYEGTGHLSVRFKNRKFRAFQLESGEVFSVKPDGTVILEYEEE